MDGETVPGLSLREWAGGQRAITEPLGRRGLICVQWRLLAPYFSPHILDFFSAHVDLTLQKAPVTADLPDGIDGPVGATDAEGDQEDEEDVAHPGHLAFLGFPSFTISVHIQDAEQIHPPESIQLGVMAPF